MIGTITVKDWGEKCKEGVGQMDMGLWNSRQFSDRDDPC